MGILAQLISGLKGIDPRLQFRLIASMRARHRLILENVIQQPEELTGLAHEKSLV